MSEDRAMIALYEDALRGRISRRTLIRRAVALGLSAPIIGALLAACGGDDDDDDDSPAATTASGAATQAPSGAATQAPAGSTAPASTRALTPTYYQWIIDLHGPAIDKIDTDYKAAHNGELDRQIAPVEGFGIERFVAEGRDQMSTWDIYVGMTPFVEMKALIEADVIEPWDDYIPDDVKSDMIQSMVDEASVDGKLYSWPFLLDVIVQGWNAELVEAADLDPEAAPKDWDEYIANAKAVVDSGAAPFGCTFDAHGWRSLAPIAHSINTDVYTEDGLFDFTSDTAIEALEIMKRMMEYSNPDVLNEGTSDAGVNLTPDEGAFGAMQVAYYVKYQNAHLRFAGTWPDPSQLRLAALPTGGSGATVFWNTGACLFKYGENKQAAADYLKALTYDQRIWQDSVAGSGENPAVGQLPIYQSVWDEYNTNRPEWMTDWAFLVFDQLKTSKAITNHKFSLTQFVLGKPHWVTYLKGEESDPKVAMQAAMDAVMAEVEKG